MTMNQEPDIHRNHNVYILGAGFSRPAGLPIIKDFLDYMRESVNWLASSGRNKELAAVKKVFQLRLRAAGAAHRMRIDPENIEELFSLASAHEDRTNRFDGFPEANQDYVSLAIAATLDYAGQKGRIPQYMMLIKNSSEFQELLSTPKLNWIFYNESSSQSKPGQHFYLPVYDFYAGLFSGNWCRQVEEIRNTVITFNYDTLLENSLSRLDIPFTYSLPMAGDSIKTEGRLPVLKLHGSVNWVFQDCAGEGPNEDILTMVPYDSYEDIIKNEDEPFLLPPTWRKVFSGTLAGIWNQSVKAIAEATRIIVVGFSLPPTDIHFRYLLAAGLQENISLRDFIVVNLAKPGQEGAIKQNFEQIFQPHFSNRIKWEFDGVQQTFRRTHFLDLIERGLDESRFGTDIGAY